MNPNRAEIIGIKPWKRWQIDSFLGGIYDELHYCVAPDEALRRQSRMGGDIVVWAAREPPYLATAAAAQRARLIRIEDGFLRSVGLGSNHVGGASLVVDDVGIYFDPQGPSALEQLLESEAFDEVLLDRAERLRQFLVQHGLSKYNVGARDGVEVGGAGRRKVLVAGQVEDDASIRCGAPGVRGNLELLRQVRAVEPEAWIVYKPHPDTEAGTRSGGIEDAAILAHADQIIRAVSPAALFPHVDAVHTITSLLGFEALLWELPVVVWGQPFYAGWGLTRDRLPLQRRTRRLSLPELIAGALIRYPRYVHPRSRRPCEVETVAAWLAGQAPGQAIVEGRRMQRWARLCNGLYRSWAPAP